MATKLENITSKLQSALAVANALPEAIDITTPLAELNATNGGIVATTIEAAVDNTETYVGNQADLISQIVTALDGKAAGGGSSGGSVETCTVTIDDPNNRYETITCSRVIDGSIISEIFGATTLSLENVVCGSVFVVHSYRDRITLTGAESIWMFEGAYNGYLHICKITTTANETVSIIA